MRYSLVISCFPSPPVPRFDLSHPFAFLHLILVLFSIYLEPSSTLRYVFVVVLLNQKARLFLIDTRFTWNWLSEKAVLSVDDIYVIKRGLLMRCNVDGKSKLSHPSKLYCDLTNIHFQVTYILLIIFFYERSNLLCLKNILWGRFYVTNNFLFIVD